MQPELFHLSFDKPFSTLLALVPALLNLFIIVYITLHKPWKSITRAFWLFTFALFLWQTDDVLARMSLTERTFDAWNEILSLGWILFGAVGVYFSLLYTGQEKLAHHPLILFFLFGPSFFFATSYNARFYPHLYAYSSFWGWVEPHNTYMLDIMMVAWLSILATLMLFILVRFALRQRAKSLIRWQASIIAAGIAFPAVQGITTQVFFPLLLNLPSIPLTSSFMSFFSIGTFIALNRYRLFSLTESVDTRVLLDNLTDMVLTVSLQERITYINRHGKKLLGIKSGEAEGMEFDQLFIASEELQKFKNEVLKPVLEGKSIENLFFGFQKNDEQPMSILCSATPIVESGKIRGALVVAHNITEIKKAEDEIREKNAELERSNAELEQFAFVASHDLREPLRMVSNYTQLLAQRYYNQLDEPAREYIDYAVDGVHRMQDLISDLLNYSRIGRTQLAKTPVNCNELLEEVMRNLQTVIIETMTSVEIGKLPTIRASKSQIGQLFQNLIENAIKFRKPGISPVIRISCEKKNGFWLFKVKDNGIGIKAEYQSKVFTLFQRLHHRQAYPGTGIGLAVCKKIVSLYNGSIWFESKEGEGTAFFFTIEV